MNIKQLCLDIKKLTRYKVIFFLSYTASMFVLIAPLHFFVRIGAVIISFFSIFSIIYLNGEVEDKLRLLTIKLDLEVPAPSEVVMEDDPPEIEIINGQVENDVSSGQVT